jgi:hypothetical protein
MSPKAESIVCASPETGQLVEVRRRQWIVAEVETSTAPDSSASPQHFVTLSSIDEDSLGEQIEVVWEIEPGAPSVRRSLDLWSYSSYSYVSP